MSEQRYVEYGSKRFPLESGLTLEQAKAIMGRHFPELADPAVTTKKDGESTVYVFGKKAGHKGSRLASVVKRLSRLKPATLIPVQWLRLAEDPDLVPVSQPVTLGADRVRDAARDLESEAQAVRKIGDALLSLPSAAQPGASIL